MFNPITMELLKDNGVEMGNVYESKIWFPCGYEDPKQMSSMLDAPKDVLVMGINNFDVFVAKDVLALLMTEKYGDKATEFIPKSWILRNEKYVHDMYNYMYEKENSDSSSLFIMKKNIQRQQGLKLTSNPNDLLNVVKDGFVVGQEVLKNPLLVNGRKTNVRVYVLVIQDPSGFRVFLHENGFVYYSKSKYIDGSTEDEVITTGYIDREVYDNSPLSTEQLTEHLLERFGRKKLDKLKTKRDRLFRKVMDTLLPYVGKDVGDATYCMFLGADIEITDDLKHIRLIEMNKDPSMVVMSDDDKIIKKKVMQDYYQKVGIIKGGKDYNNQFIQIELK